MPKNKMGHSENRTRDLSHPPKNKMGHSENRTRDLSHPKRESYH
jgi:hypothetical protein